MLGGNVIIENVDTILGARGQRACVKKESFRDENKNKKREDPILPYKRVKLGKGTEWSVRWGKGSKKNIP